MPTYSRRTIADLKPGDHLCCLYETEEEHRALLTPFLRQGLERGEKVLYIVDTVDTVDAHAIDAILTYLRDDGLTPEPYLTRGQLVVLTSDDTYMWGVFFAPESMIALLQTETEQALAEGYPALRVTGEMTPTATIGRTLQGLSGSEQLIEYESQLNEFFPGSPCLALCQYDRRRFDPATLLDVLRNHPIAVVGTEVYDNFYYVPPAELLGGDPPTAELHRWLNSLGERKQAQEELRQLNHELVLLNRELALFNRAGQAFSSSLDLDQVLAAVLEEVRRLMDVVACSIWLIEPHSPVSTGEGQGGGLVCQQATGPNSEIVRGWRLSPGEGLAGWAVRHGESLIVPDAQADERYFRDTEQQAGMVLRSILSVPLRLKQDVIGALQVVDTEADRFDAGDLALLESLAASAAIAIENARLYEQAQQEITERVRAEEALRESEQRYRQLFEGISDAVMVYSSQGGFVDCNEAALQRLGYSREELLGLEVADIVHLDFHQTMKDNQKRIWAGETTVVESALRCKDGRVIPVEVSARRIEYQGESAILALVRDITERKRAEKALRESEQRFRQMAENICEVFWMTDTRSSRMLYVSPAYKDIWQRPLEALYKDPGNWMEAIHQDDRATVIANWERQAQGHPTYEEFRIILPDGSVRWIANRAYPIKRDDTGEVYCVTGVAENITGRKWAEAEQKRLLVQIQEQAQRMQQIIDTVPEGVLLLDTDGRVILANPLGEKDLIALADAQVGHNLTHLGDRPLAELLTSPPKGLWHDVETNGRSFEVIARPLETGPEPQGWVLVIRDMTQEREIQRYIQQQDRLAAVGQLAAGIAHDFNNILAVITLYARALLRDPDLPANMVEQLEIIDQQAWQASELTQQILDFGRRAVLERRPMDLLVFLKEQVKMLERTLPESIKIKLAYDQRDYTVNADPTRVQQAIMNLVVNARDAMPEGGELHIGLERIEFKPGEPLPLPEMGEIENSKSALSKVEGSEIRNREWVRVTIADTGTGIPSDVLPHIYDPFFTTKAPDQGTGLGLAQVYGIVKQHEGHIDVTTKVGADCGQSSGTTFTLYLPALPVHKPELFTQKTERLTQGQGQTILVVEDNAATRKALVDSLEMLDYQVLEAVNGWEALTIFEQSLHQSPPQARGRGREIALVLSDLVMPEMGGQALFQALRQRDSNAKVVLMSGHPMEKELENLRAQGLSGWLVKPPSLEQLAQVVEWALKQG